jgi:Jacalin-like lectin domain.
MHYYTPTQPNEDKPLLNDSSHILNTSNVFLDFKTESEESKVYDALPIQSSNTSQHTQNQYYGQPNYTYPSLQPQNTYNYGQPYTPNQMYYGQPNQIVSGQPVTMGMTSNNQYPSNNYNQSSSYNYNYSTYHTVFNPEPKVTNDYYNKPIEGGIIKRTEMIGHISPGQTEFDDYFEKHIEKFFTPEIHEITIFHSPGYILGMHTIYRDPWGKMDKETYKGNVHLPKGLDPKQCASSKLTFDYDDYLKEIYVDGDEYIWYLKFVSNKGKVLEVGKPVNTDLKNRVPHLGRILGFGGALHLCLNALYFYYL